MSDALKRPPTRARAYAREAGHVKGAAFGGSDGVHAPQEATLLVARPNHHEGKPTMHALTQLAVSVAAATPVPTATYPSWLKIASITGLVLGIAMLLLMLFGAGLIAKARKGNISQAAQGSAVAGIGLFWIIVAATGAAIGIVGGSIGFAVSS